MAHDLGAEVLMVGTLHVYLIIIWVSLVSLFIWHFSLLIGVSPATGIILAKVVISLQERHVLDFLGEVAILSYLILIDIVQLLGHAMTMAPLFISLENVPSVGQLYL